MSHGLTSRVLRGVLALALLTPGLATGAAAYMATPATGVAQTGLATVPLTIQTATGKHRYTVEVAQSPQAQETGMMYRRSMPADHGMIFPFETARVLTFWMENTWLPLDLVFIGDDGKVVGIAADAKPMSRDLISSQVPARSVLELNGGEAARIGLRPGDKVTYKLPK